MNDWEVVWRLVITGLLVVLVVRQEEQARISRSLRDMLRKITPRY